jgi:Zn finger protein HypA/HybF involved in hydrogenase expression
MCYINFNINLERKNMKLVCYECGNKVTVKNPKNPKCNKCGSTDLDIPETISWNELFQCYTK